MLLVLSGCFLSFGVVLSTISAQRDSVGLPAPIAAHSARMGRARWSGRSEGGAPEGDGPIDADGAVRSTPAASYSRYSSDLQRGESIEDQRRQCRHAAERNGHQILPELEFSDEAVSGTTIRREGLDRLLASASRGEFRVLYLHSLSRLAREAVFAMTTLKQLVHLHGVRIITVADNMDTARDGWDLIANINSFFNERFLKELAANVFRGQEGNVLAAASVGDHCFGYATTPIEGSTARRGRNGKPQMRYVIHEEHAEWVRRIFNWFVEDRWSLTRIVRELNRRSVPKDHRSTTPSWHHCLVIRLLRNPKYVGRWPWGLRKNVRNPLTGRITQQDRSAAETEKWVREFPDLRIVHDSVWRRAQELLDVNDARIRNRRASNGTLAGSNPGHAAQYPNHLLVGLLHCSSCGGVFWVGGTRGKYMQCSNYRRGACTAKAQVPRDRAERAIVAAIAEKLLQDDRWIERLVAETHLAIEEHRQRVPAEIQELEGRLREARLRIDRLLDAIENGENSPEINLRLGQRREEVRRLEGELQAKRSQPVSSQGGPSPEWIRRQLEHLPELLKQDGPKAAHLLRAITNGRIVVEDVCEEGQKRRSPRLRFKICRSAAAESACEGQLPGVPQPASDGDEIVIDLRSRTKPEERADLAKNLWDAGLRHHEIAKRLGCTVTGVSMALSAWHRARGIPMPDNRKTPRFR